MYELLPDGFRLVTECDCHVMRPDITAAISMIDRIDSPNSNPFHEFDAVTLAGALRPMKDGVYRWQSERFNHGIDHFLKDRGLVLMPDETIILRNLIQWTYPGIHEKNGMLHALVLDERAQRLADRIVGNAGKLTAIVNACATRVENAPEGFKEQRWTSQCDYIFARAVLDGAVKDPDAWEILPLGPFDPQQDRLVRRVIFEALATQ